MYFLCLMFRIEGIVVNATSYLVSLGRIMKTSPTLVAEDFIYITT